MRDRVASAPVPLIAGVVCLILGCDLPDSVPVKWTDVADSTEIRTLLESPSMCSDCIVLERLAVMGDTTAGPGYVRAANAVIQDSLGNYWVGQRGDLKVFDSLGNFVRVVGRSGKGPMEFIVPRPRFVDSAGRVHVFDSGNVRESIVGADFELYADRPIPGRIRFVAPLPHGGRYVANVLIPTVDRIGLHLHIVEGSEVLYSFGVTGQEGASSLNSFYAQRMLTTDRFGHIFSSKFYDYVIDAWTGTGRRITGFEGPLLNETEVLPGPWSREIPPGNRILGIRTDDEGLLWVMIQQVRDDWLNGMEERVRQDGTIFLALKDNMTSIFTSRIDVIDLNRGTIIATQDRQEFFVSFVGNGLVLENRFLENGTPQLVVWSIGLDN